VGGGAFFFRDLSLYFFPLRRFVAEGLRQGQARWWNPYVHEGEPLAVPAIGYPLDLLQALWPDERFFTLLLAAHLALGAAGAFALARHLGLLRAPAVLAGAAYGLGGFALSTVNLYVYAEALGWAPLAVLGLLRAAEGGWRRVALGALPVAMCFSTTGVELALQAVVAAFVLLPRPGRPAVAAGASAAGLLLASLPLLVLSGSLEGSARAGGFATEVVLAHSIHPLTLVQTLVASWHGDTARLAESWWGQNFFPRGFPYVLSLYLGPAWIAIALVGLARGGRTGRRLGMLALAAALVCLGRWIGWGALLDHLSPARMVRFPVKAYFSVHLAAALLAGLGLDALLRDASRRAWTGLAWAAGAAGGALALAPLLPRLLPGPARWFVSGFFPPGMGLPERLDHLRFVLADGAVGGAAALAVALAAALSAHGRLRPALCAAVVTGLVAADLARAGGGLNPTSRVEALRPSEHTMALAADVRASGGRAFGCDVTSSPAYLAARARRGRHHVLWSTRALMETLTPATNVPLAVPTAFSIDLTMLVPEDRVPRPGEGCTPIGALVPRLRAAAVTRVVSLDPLDDPALSARAVLRPPALAPLQVRVYSLDAPAPRVELTPPGAGRVAITGESPGHVALRVEASTPATLVLRDAFAPGWTARAGGRPVAIAVAGGRHRAVPVPAGASDVSFDYRPPRLAVGVASSGAAALVVAALWPWRRRRSP
jgi:hypothetical protein